MYKVFLGEKSIMISRKAVDVDAKNTRVIIFKSAEDLHKEYIRFARSLHLKKLIVIGNEERAWRVFRSLFAYIEAAGGVVKNEKGNLLMIYRNKRWDLPKGKMEKDERPDQTALREVEEECGLKNLKIIRKLMLTHHIFHQDKNQWIKRTYWYEMSCKDTSRPKPQAEEGILKAEWMSKNEVQKIRNKIYPSLQEVLSISFF